MTVPRDDRRWLAPLVLLALLPLLWLFVDQEDKTGHFAGMHRYGPAPDGLAWAQHLPADEGRLYLALLAALPAALAAGWWASASRLALRALATMRRREGVVIAAAAVAATAGALAVSHVVLDRTPITDDETAYLFHARVIATTGHLVVPSPHAEEPGRDHRFYDAVFIVNDGTMYSQYPVGHPLVLSVGVLLGHPWLVPALLYGAITALLASAGRELFGRGAGAGTALACLVSPFLLAVSSTLLAHTTCLFWLSLTLVAALRATRRGGHWAFMVLAAASFGAAVITRPVSAVMIGLPLWSIPLARARRLPPGSRPRRAALAASFALTGLAMAALQLWLNDRCTGNPVRAAYFTYWLGDEGWRSPFGFGEFILGITHTPATAWANQIHNLIRLNAWLLGWPLSLALPLGAAFLERRRPHVAALVACGALPLVLYYFFFWPGISEVGPVLYTESLLAWLLLCGLAFARGPSTRRRFVLGLFATATALSLLTFHRVQLQALGRVAHEAGAVEALVSERIGDQRAIVFCEFCAFPQEQHSWVLGHPPPWPDLRDDVLFVTSWGATANRSFARRRHPDRVPYRLIRDCRSDLYLTRLDPDSPEGW